MDEWGEYGPKVQPQQPAGLVDLRCKVEASGNQADVRRTEANRNNEYPGKKRRKNELKRSNLN